MILSHMYNVCDVPHCSELHSVAVGKGTAAGSMLPQGKYPVGGGVYPVTYGM